MIGWTIVVPVKGTAGAKSRLGATEELALALALDTVDAALAVAPVVVVTSVGAAAAFEALAGGHPDARLTLVTDPGTGLDAAVAAGLVAAGDGAVAILLGDLPALTPAELSQALAAASHHTRMLVADADGSGTALVTALRSGDHVPSFGADSALRHRAAGYLDLVLPTGSGLRRDVDTPEHLAALAGRLGPRTTAALRP